jgi:spermidine synthase
LASIQTTAGYAPSSRIPAQLGNFLFVGLIVTFFLFSGASGLIYQVAWVRILSLIFGVTVYAVSTVLAGFMAGLALGSFVAGRMAGGIRNPLRAYGLVECGIGVTGLLTPWAFGTLRDAYPAINRWIETESIGWTGGSVAGGVWEWVPGLLRFALAFAILLLPTSMMGATLPIVLKSSLIRGHSLGGSVGLLYAINTFGAIAGTVGAGFFLIATYGVQASIQVAAGINLAIGVVALGYSLFVQAEKAAATAVPDEAVSMVAGEARASRGRGKIVAFAFGVSGLCALGYEVIWFRLLSLFSTDSSTYSFTMMLAMVLFGIAAGSYVVTPLLGVVGRRFNWWLAFAFLEWGIAMAAVLSVAVLANLPQAVERASNWPLISFLAAQDYGFMLVAAFVAIVPAMFLSGMTFPVAAALYAGNGPDGARRVGSLYAANVLGAIAGSTVAGFVLLPRLASQHSLVVLSVGSVLAGIAVLWAAPRQSVGRVAKLALSIGGVALFAFSVQSMPDLSANLAQARFPGAEVVWYREGLESTVTLVKDEQGHTTLFTNSRGQARDEIGLVTFHRLLAHMPMMVHPNPQRVLIVGIGAGATSGGVVQHRGVRLDAVELSDAVIEGIRQFGHINYRFFDMPNVRVIQADARNHLLTSGQKYHVISGDAIRPNDAGAGTLYSVEYFRLCADALEDDGLMTQWLAPFSDYQYKLILRTFLAAFPYVTLWQNGDLLIGSKQPITIDRARLEQRFADPQLRATLADVGLHSPGELLSRYNASEAELRRVAGDGPIITDDRPAIEYFRSLPKDDPPNTQVYSRNVNAILR